MGLLIYRRVPVRLEKMFLIAFVDLTGFLVASGTGVFLWKTTRMVFWVLI